MLRRESSCLLTARLFRLPPSTLLSKDFGRERRRVELVLFFRVERSRLLRGGPSRVPALRIRDRENPSLRWRTDGCRGHPLSGVWAASFQIFLIALLFSAICLFLFPVDSSLLENLSYFAAFFPLGPEFRVVSWLVSENLCQSRISSLFFFSAVTS